MENIHENTNNTINNILGIDHVEETIGEETIKVVLIDENNQEEHDTANEIESTTDDNNSTLQLEIIKNKLNQETIIGNDEQTD